MKKILGIFMVVMLLFVGQVYAKSSTTAEQRAANRLAAQEKRVEIKQNLTELKNLRVQLRTKVAETKILLNQYRDKIEAQEQLTDDEISQIRTTIQALKETRSTLGNEYGSIVRAMSEYKKDRSADRLTGLDNVIASQEARIQLLKAAIAKY